MFYVYDSTDLTFGYIACFASTEDAIDFMERRWDQADLFISTCDDVWEDDDCFSDDVDECGYDPYMGCYSWDC